MTPTDHDVDSVDSDERTGLNRRQMIKAAGIAGVAAWTAPMIIDSLSSPAAAATVAPGCYRTWLNFGGCGYQSTDPSSPTACARTSTGCSNMPAGVLAAASCPGNNTQTFLTINVGGGYSCRITAATAYIRLSGTTATCRSRTTNGTTGGTSFSGFGTKTLTITTSGTDEWRNNGGSNTPTNSTVGLVLTCP